jgi:hypothetical protein
MRGTHLSLSKITRRRLTTLNGEQYDN